MDDYKIKLKDDNLGKIKKGSYKFLLLLIIGISIVVICAIIFWWQEPIFKLDTSINSERWGHFGDFMGGLFGSALALVSVYLLYKAFLAQLEANRLTQKANDEMINENHRHEYSEKLEHFDANFNSLFSIYRETILGYKFEDNEAGKHSLNQLIATFLGDSDFDNRKTFRIRKDEACREFFSGLNDNLHLINTHMRLFYQLLSTLDNCEIEDADKIVYAKVLRSQLSEMELVLIRYNCYRKIGENLRPLVAKYNMMKHLPLLNLLEFKKYSRGSAGFPPDCVALVNDELILWRREICHLFSSVSFDSKTKSLERNLGKIIKITIKLSGDSKEYNFTLSQTKKDMTGVNDKVIKAIVSLPNEVLKSLVNEFHKEVFEIANFGLWNHECKPNYNLAIKEEDPKAHVCRTLNCKIISKRAIIVSYDQIRIPTRNEVSN